ncbi:Ctr copper transporter [Saitoella complicata NRRL Y-17804]|uniref:Ctr copper transporter n=1 Tax=Saitoella complicata (strain BCRC 22490 / CBS 7301 / JCM 7358 / NBRC 10748 / NRRL Y-17804) TaxID=698492 RepID=UPI000868280A|nr:Ctr copper transporter [Saitoella complicata NRRL Y-17804]ODQ52307.1 Ctr copper transporter [Saitoella complicata NRRL Y-17804]
MDHGSGSQCITNMLFNWDTTNLCIVFPSWRITDNTSLVLSFVAVVFMGMSYEWLRRVARSYDAYCAKLVGEGDGRKRRDSVPKPASGSVGHEGSVGVEEEESVFGGVAWRKGGRVNSQRHMIRALLYAMQVSVSFFLMLVFMTYNAYFILAVTLGAFLGFYIFQQDTGISSQRGMACH